uniref:Uncharacterized protein n=1 Tax=Arundo donax TaxID=35708 RepID=A0A0A9BDJ9_ARUDO
MRYHISQQRGCAEHSKKETGINILKSQICINISVCNP